MPSSKTHVLIVDDSATIRRVIRRLIDDNCISLEASDGEAALEIIASNPEIRMVFADMHMPVMNGMMLLDKIRSSNNERIASLPVVIITGHEDTDAAKRASHNMGATEFISKPFDSFDILNCVESYIPSINKASFKKNKNVVTEKTPAAKPAKTVGPLRTDTTTSLQAKDSFMMRGASALKKSQSESSVLFMQIVDINEVFKTHGKQTTVQIIQSIASHLSKTLRDNELLSHEATGMFHLLLPGTNEFKANIVAIRIQQQINSLTFKKGDDSIRIKLAIGISSSSNDNTTLMFPELCQQSEDALQMSLEHPNHAIIRYDETYEKRLNDEKSRHHASTATTPDKHSKAINLTELSQYLPYMITREFDKIPAFYLEQMIEPAQDLLKYASLYSEVKVNKTA